LVYEAFTDQGVLEVQINTLTQSVEVAERALLRAIESHRNGQIRYTDLRTAQVNKLQAESALVSARMNLLRLRYSVKRLSGELLE
jgi:outer membrane protein TolC